MRLCMYWLTVVLQRLLKTLAGKEYTALDSAERKIHLFGNLIVLVAGDMHRERYAVVITERVDGGGYLLGGNRTLRGLETGILRQIKMIQILCLVDYRSRTHNLAVVVYEDIAHDCEDPSLEVDVVNIFVLVVERL